MLPQPSSRIARSFVVSGSNGCSGNVRITADAAPYPSGGDQIIKMSASDGSILGVYAVTTPYAVTNMSGATNNSRDLRNQASSGFFRLITPKVDGSTSIPRNQWMRGVSSALYHGSGSP